MTVSKYKTWGMILLLLAASLHLGTIRKEEDPIAKAQTDPISLKQKMEEIKDGVKGAPTPSFRYYEKEDFLTRTPMGVGIEDAPLGKPAHDIALEAVSEVETEEAGDFWHDSPSEAGGDDGGENTASEDQDTSETPSGEEKAGEEDDWWMEEPA